MYQEMSKEEQEKILLSKSRPSSIEYYIGNVL